MKLVLVNIFVLYHSWSLLTELVTLWPGVLELIGHFKVAFCLCENKSSRKTIHMKMSCPTGSFSCRSNFYFQNVQRFCTKTCFKTKVQGNLEMAYCARGQGFFFTPCGCACTVYKSSIKMCIPIGTMKMSRKWLSYLLCLLCLSRVC